MSSAQTDSEEAGAQDAWTYFELPNGVVDDIRDAIESRVPDEWERIEDAHISILPGFDVAAADVDIALDCITYIGLGYVGDEIAINGIECFHELDEAGASFVVKLDVDIDLETIRAEQEKWVNNYGGSLNFVPVEPHVTLFKAGDGDDDHEPLSDDQRTELKAAIADVDIPETLTVESLEAETY
jgi:hypothetical protein